MKALQTLSKNLKLLFRSKESAFMIIAGPILIILLVSFAFLGSSDDFDLSLAVYPAEQSEFASEVVDELSAKGYGVSVYGSEDECIESVRTGTRHACLVILGGTVGEDVIPIDFYLDLSRINIVYQIADDLSGIIELEADVIREQLATDALHRMRNAADLLDNVTVSLDSAIMSLGDARNSLTRASEAIEGIPDAPENTTSLSGLSGFYQGLAANTRNAAEISIDQMDESIRILDDVARECGECEEEFLDRVDALKDEIRKTQEDLLYISDELTADQLQDAGLLLERLTEDVERVEEMARDASNAAVALSSRVDDASTSIGSASQETQQAKARASYAADLLRGRQAEVDTLKNPITERIHSITMSDDRLSFAYPYLLILVIMFMGMLLSSTLIVMDKTSKAAFRTFTTPTRDSYHVFFAFLTAFIILIAEILVVILLSGLFVAQPLLLNPGPTILIIIVSIVLFTFIGMIIGYLSRTQEASMIASISVGSVLLFVSNLVLPVEGMTAIVQSLTKANPYVVLSELLKKSMLYGVSVSQVTRDLIFVFVVALVLLVLTMLTQRKIKQRYFRQEDTMLTVKQRVPKPLNIGGKLVHTPMELMDVLDGMTREEFGSIMEGGNVIATWVEKELRLSRLAKRLRTTNKEKMMLRLDKYLERHGKRLGR